MLSTNVFYVIEFLIINQGSKLFPSVENELFKVDEGFSKWWII